MQRSLARIRHDTCSQKEYMEISTGPGRYAMGVPDSYRSACFVPEPTMRMQKWGASHDMGTTKTDVESDLLNISRPSSRTVCGQWDPTTAPQRELTPMPECTFPQTHARLVDPPCNLRGTGWNRWEWLCQNPQENVMVPFEWLSNSRMAEKDNYKPIPSSSFKYSNAADQVPIPRMPGPNDVRDFTNQIPGADMRYGSPPAVQGNPALAPISAPNHPDAVPLGPPSVPSERIRAQTGQYGAPAMFVAS